MTQSFFVPCKIISWNSIATAHWRKYQNFKGEMIKATWAALKEARVKPVPGSLQIVITAHKKTKRLYDLDNLFLKSILDTLVREHIIKGDTLDIVRSLTIRGEIGSIKEGFTIELVSVN